MASRFKSRARLQREAENMEALLGLFAAGLFIVLAAAIRSQVLTAQGQALEAWTDLTALISQRRQAVSQLADRLSNHDGIIGESARGLRQISAQLAAIDGTPHLIAQAEITYTSAVSMALSQFSQHGIQDAVYAQARSEISGLSHAIQDQARRYNDAVDFMNKRISHFPYDAVASWLGVACAELFSTTDVGGWSPE
jgi:hypothetical protein